MIGEARTIGRIVEVLHIPVQHQPDVLREIYLEVSGSCGYDNFIRLPAGARLEAAATEEGGASRVTFQGDRVIFQEEKGSAGLEGFQERVREVLGLAAKKLQIPLFLARSVTARAVAAVPSAHAAQFLGQNLVRIEADEFGEFGRAGQLVGLKMLFPATNPQNGTHTLRVETYLRDPRSLFLEDQARFKLPVQSTDEDRVGTELNEVEEFLHDRVSAFLNRFPRSEP